MRVLLRYETAESTGREIYEEYELAFLGTAFGGRVESGNGLKKGSLS
jgi:hypothetical protein